MFAVLTADLLLARALELCATTSPELTVHLTRAVERACHGRLAELSAHRRPTPPPISEWLELSAHTGLAALAAAACELGARAAGAPTKTIQALATYGGKLGAASQLFDDARRLSGETDHLGRDALADLDDETPSVPFRIVLDHWAADAGQYRAQINSRGTRQDQLTELTRLITKTSALEQTCTWVRRLLLEADQALRPLPEGPARDSLKAIAQRATRQVKIQQHAQQFSAPGGKE